MKIFIILFTLIFSQAIFAYENDFALKVGVYYSVSNITSIKVSNEPPMGAAISTHVGYRYTQWEFNFSSYLNFAKFKDVRIRVNESNIHGDGTLNSITFGPTVRYYDLNYSTPFGTPYYVVGAHAIVQSFHFGFNNVEVDGGRFNGQNNLNTKGFGALLALGFDKSVGKNSKKRNFFLELAYSGNQSKRKSEVESSNTQIRLIRSDSSTQPVYEQTFFLGVGLTLF